MNRAAAPAAETGSPPKDLRQGATGIGATRQHVTVVAVRRGKPVARFEQRYHGDTGRLLSNIEVIVADELLLIREPQHGFLKPAYHQHLFEMFPGEFFVQGQGGASHSKRTCFRCSGTPQPHPWTLAVSESLAGKTGRGDETGPGGVAFGAVTQHVARGRTDVACPHGEWSLGQPVSGLETAPGLIWSAGGLSRPRPFYGRAFGPAWLGAGIYADLPVLQPWARHEPLSPWRA